MLSSKESKAAVAVTLHEIVPTRWGTSAENGECSGWFFRERRLGPTGHLAMGLRAGRDERMPKIRYDDRGWCKLYHR